MKTSPYSAVCREPECSQPILMVFTRHGHWQPLDTQAILAKGPATARLGDVVVVGQGDEARAVVLTDEEMADGQVRYRRKPHAATCIARHRRAPISA